MSESSSQFSLPFVKQFFAKIFGRTLRKTHFENLCLSIYGLVGSRSGLLSEIVRWFPAGYAAGVTHKHRLKRLGRFFSNLRFKPEKIMTPWVEWCANRFACNGRLLVAVDWTALPGNYQCLMAAVPFYGRAIPLYWRIVSNHTFEKSQNRLEEQFLRTLTKIVPKDVMPVIIADRGFGRASLFQFLIDLKVLFVVRIKSDVWITLCSGVRRKLSKMRVKPNRGRWYPNITYREDSIVGGLNLAATAVENNPDHWFLVTNLNEQKETILNYAKRFEIEEFFKDTKHQLGIADTQTKDSRRIHRLLCMACLSYGMLAIIGKTIERHMEIANILIRTGKEKVASYIWFALNAIRHNLIDRPVWQEMLAELGP